jgi:hypothetical protein
VYIFMFQCAYTYVYMLGVEMVIVIKKNVKQRVVMSIELLVRIHTWEKICELYTIFSNFISV